jgi:hypothetical protein
MSYLKLLIKRYKYHMSMCLIILTFYLLGEFGFYEDEYSLWYVYGWSSLLIPMMVVIPMLLMSIDTYKHLKNKK